MEAKMNSIGDQETKFNDKRTEETESQRKPNQVLILEIKKARGSNKEGEKKNTQNKSFGNHELWK